MPAKRKEREPLRLGGHYARINGEVVEIDPTKTDLPIRCKLALAEMATGIPHKVVKQTAT
jgi:hypothetical protein